MKVVAAGVLVISMVLLLLIVFKRRLGWHWLSIFATHLVLAAIGLYLINFSGLVSGIYVPINPVTISAVTLLGLPGVLMLLGLKIVLF